MSTNYIPKIRKTIFHMDKNRIYSFDVNEEITIHTLKKMLSSAANLGKVSLRIFHNGKEYTNSNNETIQNLFPNLQEIEFTLQIQYNQIDDLDSLIKLKLNTHYCPLHNFKYPYFYCFTCKKSVCSNCILSNEHNGHDYKEKYDYLQNSKILVEQIFNDLKFEFPEIDSDLMKSLVNKISYKLFPNLVQLVKNIEKKLIDLVKNYITKEKDNIKIIQDDLKNLKQNCADGLDELKEQISIEDMMLNEEIFLTFDSKFKDICKEKDKIKNNCFEMNVINDIIDKVYNEIYNFLIQYINKEISVDYNKNNNFNPVNNFGRKEIFHKLLSDIHFKPKIYRVSNKNNHNKYYDNIDIIEENENEEYSFNNDNKNNYFNNDNNNLKNVKLIINHDNSNFEMNNNNQNDNYNNLPNYNNIGSSNRINDGLNDGNKYNKNNTNYDEHFLTSNHYKIIDRNFNDFDTSNKNNNNNFNNNNFQNQNQNQNYKMENTNYSFQNDFNSFDNNNNNNMNNANNNNYNNYNYKTETINIQSNQNNFQENNNLNNQENTQNYEEHFTKKKYTINPIVDNKNNTITFKLNQGNDNFNNNNLKNENSNYTYTLKEYATNLIPNQQNINFNTNLNQNTTQNLNFPIQQTIYKTTTTSFSNNNINNNNLYNNINQNNTNNININTSTNNISSNNIPQIIHFNTTKINTGNINSNYKKNNLDNSNNENLNINQNNENKRQQFKMKSTAINKTEKKKHRIANPNTSSEESETFSQNSKNDYTTAHTRSGAIYRNGHMKSYDNYICQPIENTNQVLIYDSINDTITKNEINSSIFTIEKFPINCSWFNKDNVLYISGGIIKNKICKIFLKYDPIKKSIERLIDLPEEKINHTMIFDNNNNLYIIGGNSNSVLKYNLDNQKWITLNLKLKNERNNPMCFIKDNFIYVFWGMNNYNNYITSIEKIDLNSKNSFIINEDNIHLIFSGIIQKNENLYFIGGKNKNGFIHNAIKYNFQKNEIEFNSFSLGEGIIFKQCILPRLNKNTYGNFNLDFPMNFKQFNF